MAQIVIIDHIKGGKKCPGKVNTIDTGAILEKQGRCRLTQIWRKLLPTHVDIDANTEHDTMNCVGLGTHFIEETCNLLTIKQNIVRPFNRWLQPRNLFDRPGNSNC